MNWPEKGSISLKSFLCNGLCNAYNNLSIDLWPFTKPSLCDFISHQCQGERSTFMLYQALHRSLPRKNVCTISHFVCSIFKQPHFPTFLMVTPRVACIILCIQRLKTSTWTPVSRWGSHVLLFLSIQFLWNIIT